MTEKIVEVEPQKIQPVEEPKKPDAIVEGVTIPKTEYEDLKHRADVSSQNFERLKKEQERIADLESEIAELKTSVPSQFRDERVDAALSELANIKAKQAKTDVIEKYPMLKDEWNEFEKFCDDPDNKGMALSTAAKAFLAEKGLLTNEPRKGLERPTGGDRKPVQTGMTNDEVKRLRETDYKKYREMLSKGQIKIV